MDYKSFIERGVRVARYIDSSSSNKINYLDLIDLVHKISNWKLSEKAKLLIRKEFYDTVREIGEEKFPEYLRSNERRSLKLALAYDRNFCKGAKISYDHFDKHNADIDLALAFLPWRNAERRLYGKTNKSS